MILSLSWRFSGSRKSRGDLGTLPVVTTAATTTCIHIKKRCGDHVSRPKNRQTLESRSLYHFMNATHVHALKSVENQPVQLTTLSLSKAQGPMSSKTSSRNGSVGVRQYHFVRQHEALPQGAKNYNIRGLRQRVVL